MIKKKVVIVAKIFIEYIIYGRKQFCEGVCKRRRTCAKKKVFRVFLDFYR